MCIRDRSDVVGSGSIWLKHLEEGEGFNDAHPVRAEPGQSVLVRYTGRVVGEEHAFERTDDQGRRIRIGDEDIPTGLEMCIRLMCQGGRAKARLDARHAYADAGRDGVPPGSDVEFDVEVVELGSMTGADDALDSRMGAALEDIEKALDRYRSEDYPRSLKFIERACAHLPEPQGSEEFTALKVRAENNAVMVTLKLDMHKEAVAHAQNVLQVDPGNPKALWRAGTACLHLQEFSEATEFANKGLALHPAEKTFQTLAENIVRKQSKQKKSEKKMIGKMFKPDPEEDVPSSSSEAEAASLVSTRWFSVGCACVSVLVAALLIQQFS
eukprot:TRINITY_DN15630_c0_g1_i2.p1 TRINITY_DN15630_c0_g1~~TRINITY_DN15630_c0_g1_i2.p1  ORF type:complete len:326 (-),score=77.97 TRINITY_DN15630_c0_g1_i2:304-1281(-)